MVGEEMNPLFTDFTLADIGKAADVMAHGTCIIAHHRHHQPFGEIVTMLMSVPNFALPESRLF